MISFLIISILFIILMVIGIAVMCFPFMLIYSFIKVGKEKKEKENNIK